MEEKEATSEGRMPAESETESVPAAEVPVAAATLGLSYRARRADRAIRRLLG